MLFIIVIIGLIRCGGIPMAIGVQSDMCTPALSNFGSHELKQQFLAPNISGDVVGCIGVSETDAGSDVASITTKAVKRGGKLIVSRNLKYLFTAYILQKNTF